MADTCKSCGAKVIWAKNEKSGKPMIFDVEPVDGGQWVVKEGVAYYVKKENVLDGKMRGHVSHFATCPNARSHRRKR